MVEDLVTIYIPTHNREKLVERAVKSVLSQTYKNLEVIICDDGSADSTWECLNKLKLLDDRIRLLRNTEPRGACFSRNRCIEIAEGEYITGLDDDDEFLPDRVDVFMNFIRCHDYDILSSNLFYKSNKSMIKGERFHGVISKKMIGYRNVIGNQVFTKTSIIKAVGGFDSNAPAWQDYDLWFRLINQGYHCYRLPDATYIMDISHDAPRITTSSKAYLGYQYFVRKHQSLLSKYQLNSLYLEDKKNRGIIITLFDVLKKNCLHGYKEYIKTKVKDSFPLIKKIIERRKKITL
ncbi:glycosyltransferase [Klebsiella oxytoca]